MNTLRVILLALLTSSLAFAEIFIVDNGRPNAEIVIAPTRPRMTTLAALELQAYVQQISGARLPIVTEPGALPVKLYVGASSYAEKLGVTDDGLKFGAYRLVSGPSHLVMLGHDVDFQPLTPWPADRKDMDRAQAEWDKRVGDRTDSAWGYPFASGFKAHWANEISAMEKRYGKDNAKWWDPAKGFADGFWVHDQGGSLNAVYAILRDLGVRWYMPGDVGEVVPKLKSIPLPEKDATVKPDFDLRAYTWYNYSGFSFADVIWGRRLGMNSAEPLLGNMGYAHGLSLVHRRKEMQDKHPEYYALQNGKRVTDYRGYGHVCFSNEDFFNETVNFARFVFDEFNQPHVSLWPMDGFHKCQCEKCGPQDANELVWGFVDRVARELYKTHPDRMVSCGAYTPYIYAPTSVEKFTPNVYVFIANRSRPLLDDPVRWKAYQKQLADWQAKLEPKHLLRVENNRFGLTPTFPVIHPHTMAKDLHMLKGISLGEQCEESQEKMAWNSPGIDHLTLYVQSRFLWDADQDLEPLLDEYYTLFYGPAKDEMRAAIEYAEAKYSRTDNSRNGGRCDPRNVSDEVKLHLLELLLEAKEAAGFDTVYAKRIQTILSELPDMDTVKFNLEVRKMHGDPRANPMQIIAHPHDYQGERRTYPIREGLSERDNVTQETTFQISWDKAALYLDIRCHEDDMANLAITEDVWEGDSVILLLETPSHSYYQIEINPDGKVFDVDRWGGVVTRWQCAAEITSERGDDFWRLQVRLPIAIVGQGGGEMDPFNYVVGPEPGTGDWFLNIGRRRVRDGEAVRSIFSPSLSRNYFTPENFAKLIFTTN